MPTDLHQNPSGFGLVREGSEMTVRMWQGNAQRLPSVALLVAVGVFVLASCNWSQFRYGPDGTGFNPFERTIGPSNASGLHQRWSESLSGVIALVVANGVVYATASDGTLDAFDATTGTGKWSFVGSSGATTPPAVADGTVYYMANGIIYAIDATSGTKRWSTDTGAPYSWGLVVAAGVLYVADGYLLAAFNATTGATLWSESNAGSSGSGIPAVANGILYTTPSNLRNNLWAQNATTGAVLWSEPASSCFGGGRTPAVAGGVVYTTAAGSLFAFNATTGAYLWSAAAGDPCVGASSPSVAKGVVFESTNDLLGPGDRVGTLFAFNATTGKQLWSVSTSGASIASDPVVANGVVYLGGADGKIDAFNATSGAPLWSSTASGTAPIVVDGVLYATSGDGHIYAYSLPVPGAGLTMSPTFAPDDGTVLDGTSSPPTTFTITNFGSAPTTALSTELTGIDPSQFRITSDTCVGTSLKGGASCTIGAEFAPTLAGVRKATLIASAATGGTAGATLSGVGNPLTVDPTATDFGTVLDGTSSSPATFTVTNHGLTTAKPSVASLVGSQFTVISDGCTGATLAHGGTCNIVVAFTATGVGPASASLSITSTPGGSASATLSALAAPVSIVPTSRDYGIVPVGSSSLATFTSINVGSVALGPVALVTGSGFSVSSDGCAGTTLAPGAHCNVVIAFTPGGPGTTYQGQLMMVVPGYGFAVPVSKQVALAGTGG